MKYADALAGHKEGCYLDTGHKGHCRTRKHYRPDPVTREDRIEALQEMGYGRGRAIQMVDETMHRLAENERLISDQPAPVEGNGDMWKLVIKDMEFRREVGINRYGTPLQAHNGRKPLVDAYQEALDLVVYLRQRIEEEEGR